MSWWCWAARASGPSCRSSAQNIVAQKIRRAPQQGNVGTAAAAKRSNLLRADERGSCQVTEHHGEALGAACLVGHRDVNGPVGIGRREGWRQAGHRDVVGDVLHRHVGEKGVVSRGSLVGNGSGGGLQGVVAQQVGRAPWEGDVGESVDGQRTDLLRADERGSGEVAEHD